LFCNDRDETEEVALFRMTKKGKKSKKAGDRMNKRDSLKGTPSTAAGDDDVEADLYGDDDLEAGYSGDREAGLGLGLLKNEKSLSDAAEVAATEGSSSFGSED